MGGADYSLSLTRQASWDPGRTGRGRVRALARLVRIEHTLFSLPYAYAGACLACSGCIGLREAVLIGLAVLGLRTAAMAYNNLADMDIDALNPRTRSRPLVTGAVKPRDAWVLVLLGSVLYYASAVMINKYTMMLSPLPWILAMTYPHAKRIHWLPHIHLGLVLGLVIFGGSVASLGMIEDSVSRVLAGIPWIYVVAVALWVAGFDTYYAILDVEFDRRHGVGSIPARLGAGAALDISLAMHASTALLLALGVVAYNLGFMAALGVVLSALLLAYQHVLLRRRGVAAIPEAFNTNLAIGIVIAVPIVLDRLVSTGC